MHEDAFTKDMKRNMAKEQSKFRSVVRFKKFRNIEQEILDRNANEEQAIKNILRTLKKKEVFP